MLTRKPVVVAGATGYMGGRLAPRLIERGSRFHCLACSVAKLRAAGRTDTAAVDAPEFKVDRAFLIELDLKRFHHAGDGAFTPPVGKIVVGGPPRRFRPATT